MTSDKHDVIRTFKGRKRPVIGVLIDWLTSQYQVEIITGILDIARQEDASVLIFEGGVLGSPFEYELPRNMLYSLASKESVDGIVVIAGSIGHYKSNNELCDFLGQYKDIPIVSVSRQLKGYPSIVLDNLYGMRQLLEHFIYHHGHRRIAIVKGHKDNLDAVERFATYIEILKDNNIVYDPSLIVSGKFNSESGIEAIKTLMDVRKVSFDAVIALNDEMALGMIGELRRRGISVPGELAVAGFDNIKMTRYSSPPLTTVNQPTYKIGNTAGEYLIRLMRGISVPSTTALATELVTRESCGCANPKPKSFLMTLSRTRKVTFQEIFKKKRDRIIEEIANILTRINSKCVNERIRELIAMFLDLLGPAVVQGKCEKALAIWDELLYHLMLSEVDILSCEEIIRVIEKELIIPTKDKRVILNTQELIYRAQRITARRAIQEEIFVHRRREEDNYRLNTLRDNLLAMSDVKRLADILAGDLPPLGFESAYFSIYTGGGQKGKKQAKLFLAYDKQRQPKIDKVVRIFPPKEIVPSDIQISDHATVMVVEAFAHTNEFIGFMVIDCSLRKYSIYEEIRRTVSRALNAALLFEEVQIRTKALRSSEKSLRAITGAIPIPLLIFRKSDGGIVYANGPFAAAFGNLAKKKENNFKRIFCGTDAEFISLLRHLENVKNLSGLEMRLRRRGGATFWVIASFQTLVFDGERCFIAGFYDITERRLLEKEVLDISSREQKRIGQELHDDICQDLVGISTLVQAIGNSVKDIDPGIAERAEYVSELANTTNEKTQRLAHNLFPQEMDEKGLAVMLREFAARVQKQYNIKCTCTFSIRESITDNIALLHLYRIAQEAVHNAVKHADPRSVRIIFVSDQKRIELDVEDDGSGFPADTTDNKGIGLRSMHYRASQLEGKLVIRKNGERGTKVSCIIDKAVRA